MAERPAKLRRLEDLRRNNPHISASALSEIITDIEKNGLPDLHGRKHVKEARDFTLKAHDAYGPMLETTQVVLKNGERRDILYVNLPTLLQAMFGQGGSMAELIYRTMEHNPSTTSSPWGLIYYNDEVVPGNVLSADTSRKVQCVYISFAEFGPLALSKEESWMCVLACRSSRVSEIDSGMSQVTAALLKELLYPKSCAPKASGILLKDEHGKTCRLHYKLGLFLQDGAAHKAIFSLKGDGGTKFCIFCQNLVTQKSGLKEEDGSDTLVANEWDLSKITQATNRELCGTMARLEEQSKVLNKGDFSLWQQAVGFNYQEHGLLHSKALSGDILPITQFVHDWMHCFLVSGIFQTVMFLLLGALEAKFGHLHNIITDCIQQWHLPAAKSAPLHTLFTQKRQTANTKAGTFKCTASEALGLLPLFAYFLQTIVMPHADPSLQTKCSAFFALADIIDLIQLVPLGKITPAHLESACSNFIGLCLQSEWQNNMHTKFHWVLHFPGHLKLHKQLPSCFVQERKHKVVKRHLEHICIVQGLFCLVGFYGCCFFFGLLCLCI